MLPIAILTLASQSRSTAPKIAVNIFHVVTMKRDTAKGITELKMVDRTTLNVVETIEEIFIAARNGTRVD